MAKAITLKSDSRKGPVEDLYPLTQTQLVYDDRDGRKHGLNETLTTIEGGFDKKVDKDWGAANKDKLLGTDSTGKVIVKDYSGGVYGSGDGVIVNNTEWKISADWDKVARKFPLTAPTPDKKYRLPYFFKTSADANKVTVTAETILLDNETFDKEEFPMDVTAATESLAGIMAADDKKQIRLNKEAIAAEETRAKAAEKANADAITAETARATAAEGTLTTNLAAEVTNRTNADTALENNIVAEKNRAEGAETTLQSNITAEETRAKGEEAKMIQLLGTEAGSGEPYHFTYFYDFTPAADKITAHVDTITLDNNKTLKRYDKDIVGATSTTAGLMTAADKTKLDTMINDTTESSATVWSSSKTRSMLDEYSADWKGTYKTHAEFKAAASGISANKNDYVIVLDDTYNVSEHYKESWKYIYAPEAVGLEIDKWAPVTRISNIPFTTDQWTTIDSKLYNGAIGQTIAGGIDVSKKLDKLISPDPSGLPRYHIPYDLEQDVQAEAIQIKLQTVTLDGEETKLSFADPRHKIGAADIANNKAGLYTQTLANLKVDRSVKDAQDATNIIDNQAGQNGCVMQTQLADTNGTIVSFNTASENGADGVLAQVYAKNTTGPDTGKGMRLNFTKSGAYYGVGASTPIDADHEIAVKGDIKAQIAPQTATITTGGWGSAATGDLFVKNITITGIKSTDYPIVGTAFDADTAAEIEAQQEAAAHIVKAAAYDGGITFYADEAPAVDIPIIVRSM